MRLSGNGHRTMFHWRTTRECGIHARALARRTDCIHAIVVIASNFCYKLRLEYIAVADCKARHLAVAVDDSHLEAIGLAMLQRKVYSCIRNHIGLLCRNRLCC